MIRVDQWCEGGTNAYEAILMDCMGNAIIFGNAASTPEDARRCLKEKIAKTGDWHIEHAQARIDAIKEACAALEIDFG